MSIGEAVAMDRVSWRREGLGIATVGDAGKCLVAILIGGEGADAFEPRPGMRPDGS